MTTSLQTDPRRSARANPGSTVAPRTKAPLEMPVLFQLADLSLSHFKVIVPPSPPAPAAETKTVISEPVPATPEVIKFEPPTIEIPKADISKAEIATLAPQAEQVVALPSPPELEIKIAEPVIETKAEPLPSANPPAVEATLTSNPPPSSSSESAIVASDATAKKLLPLAPQVSAPIPREHTEQRGRSRPAKPASGDWMRTHGKFIAVGFVFALIATIYMAQNGDEPAPPQQDPSTRQSEAAQKPADEGSKITEAQTAVEAGPGKDRGGSPSLLSEANPANAANPHEAHAELHAPESKNVIKEPSGASEVADSKSLFPWKDSAEPRVATKPEGPRVKPPAESTAPRSEFVPPDVNRESEAPSIYGPVGGPENPAQPPAAENRAAEQPAASGGPQLNPPGTYPVTNPGTFRDFAPPETKSAPTQSAPPQSASPASYQNLGSNQTPQQPRTSGPRYERTGSGLY